MKLLSITIPCFNSAAYMGKAIEAALKGGEDVEILVVDDGSSDDTLKIAEEYQTRYPSIVKAIHKENGGHGSAVNTGLDNATGIFFKVCDSDDYLEETAYKKALAVLKHMVEEGQSLDMLLSNYVYDKVQEGKRKIINYRSAFPVNRIFTWNDVKKFHQGQYILMHSVIYRTKLLRDCGLRLPEHCFYVDNIYVYQPLPFVKTMYYLDVDLYMYYIGRADQSVNAKNMMKRIDQQLLVTRTMINLYDLKEIKNLRLRSYMLSYLGIMMTISSVFLIKIGTAEANAKKKELWEYLKVHNTYLYKEIGGTFLGKSSKARTHFGQTVVKVGYNLANRIFKFN